MLSEGVGQRRTLGVSQVARTPTLPPPSRPRGRGPAPGDRLGLASELQGLPPGPTTPVLLVRRKTCQWEVTGDGPAAPTGSGPCICLPGQVAQLRDTLPPFTSLPHLTRGTVSQEAPGSVWALAGAWRRSPCSPRVAGSANGAAHEVSSLFACPGCLSSGFCSSPSAARLEEQRRRYSHRLFQSLRGHLTVLRVTSSHNPASPGPCLKASVAVTKCCLVAISRPQTTARDWKGPDGSEEP